MAHHPDQSFPLLVIDTSSPITTIGIATAENGWEWASEHTEAGVALFTCLERVLNRTGIPLNTVRTLAFCEGPGSMLGIRTAAMAIRMWVASGVLREVRLMAYSSLNLAATGLMQAEARDRLTTAIDARRQSWHCLTIDPGSHRVARMRRVPHLEIGNLTDPVFLPEGFPVWNPRPPDWLPCSYSPQILENKAIRAMLLREIEQPDAYQPEPPVYQKWIPSISRPPEPSPARKETTS